ncbi:SLOG family protein [Streptomyces abikoensis]|uniref:SLOG family protein n=1 Tax=Streptomyces abikoensis TaxID=97398 RepID=A0ABW7T350_9ACTN
MTHTAASRVLICGSRRWPWPDTVTTLLDRAAARYGDDLVIIEGASTGAARAAHRWCLDQDLPDWRHRCHPLIRAGRRTRRHWSEVERNQRMLQDEGPRLVIAFHDRFTPDEGSTAQLCQRALTAGIPVWLVPTADPDRGMWLSPDHVAHQHNSSTRCRQTTPLSGPARTASESESGPASLPPPP